MHCITSRTQLRRLSKQNSYMYAVDLANQHILTNQKNGLYKSNNIGQSYCVTNIGTNLGA